MAQRVKELTESLNLGNVEIVTNTSQLSGNRKEQRASLILKRATFLLRISIEMEKR